MDGILIRVLLNASPHPTPTGRLWKLRLKSDEILKKNDWVTGYLRKEPDNWGQQGNVEACLKNLMR